jgi:hypothetical protein
MAPSPQAYHTMMMAPVSVSTPPAAPMWDYSGVVHAMNAMHLQSPIFGGLVLDSGPASHMLADDGIHHSLNSYLPTYVNPPYKHHRSHSFLLQCFDPCISIVQIFYMFFNLSVVILILSILTPSIFP